MNETEIDTYLQKIIADNGKLDIVFNGIGSYYQDSGSGTPTTLATFEQFMNPLQRICGSQFLTSRVAAKHMIQSESEGHASAVQRINGRNQDPQYGRFRRRLCSHRGIDQGNGRRVWSARHQSPLHLLRCADGDQEDPGLFFTWGFQKEI